MTDEADPRGRGFIDEEFAGVSEVFVDDAASLRGDRHQDGADVGGNGGGRLRGGRRRALLRLRLQFLADRLVDHGSLFHRGRVIDVHRVDLFKREFRPRSSPNSPTASARHCRQCRIMFMSPEHLS